MIMKNRFFIIALETFLGHLSGVGWSPACENTFFTIFIDFGIIAIVRDRAWYACFKNLKKTKILKVPKKSLKGYVQCMADS